MGIPELARLASLEHHVKVLVQQIRRHRVALRLHLGAGGFDGQSVDVLPVEQAYSLLGFWPVARALPLRGASVSASRLALASPRAAVSRAWAAQSAVRHRRREALQSTRSPWPSAYLMRS